MGCGPPLAGPGSICPVHCSHVHGHLHCSCGLGLLCGVWSHASHVSASHGNEGCHRHLHGEPARVASPFGSSCLFDWIACWLGRHIRYGMQKCCDTPVKIPDFYKNACVPFSAITSYYPAEHSMSMKWVNQLFYHNVYGKTVMHRDIN